MNEQLKFLIELQEVDSAILAIVEKIEALPRKLDQFKAPLKEANEGFQKAKTHLDTLNKKKKDRDHQLDELQDKINKLRARSGDIKTNKEYEAHLKEIQVFEHSMSGIEDDILVMMEEIETFEKELKGKESQVKQAEEELRQQEKVLGEEQKELEALLAEKKTRRKEYASRIDEEYFIHYMNLLKRLGDRAVVETRNEVCLGCNTNIPPQLYNDIKKNEDIFNCFYCKRFLYYKEPPPGEGQPPEPGQSS